MPDNIEKPEGVSQEAWDRMRATTNSEETREVLGRVLGSDDSTSTED